MARCSAISTVVIPSRYLRNTQAVEIIAAVLLEVSGPFLCVLSHHDVVVTELEPAIGASKDVMKVP
jgi:hypothetical protein